MNFPNGAQFAFTIFDDTDYATAEKGRPIYDLLFDLKILTTKSVWVFKGKNTNNLFSGPQTLEDDEYIKFIQSLIKRGFEIGFHNASMMSSKRATTLRALHKFNELLGFYPRVHANHRDNKENLYWGADRSSFPLLQFVMRMMRHPDSFTGHKQESLYFWGDLCKEYITYVRNFVFNEINLCNINPTLPYHDSKKEYVQWWFSSSDGATVEKFNRLLTPANQEKLEKEKGVCIAYTHFGYDFVKNGKVNDVTKKLLIELSKRNGWFVPVSTLLDYLREQRVVKECTLFERLRMEFTWVFQNILK